MRRAETGRFVCADVDATVVNPGVSDNIERAFVETVLRGASGVADVGRNGEKRRRQVELVGVGEVPLFVENRRNGEEIGDRNLLRGLGIERFGPVRVDAQIIFAERFASRRVDDVAAEVPRDDGVVDVSRSAGIDAASLVRRDDAVNKRRRSGV